MTETVFHEFPPLFDPESKVLILGTIPSPKSRQQGFYYGHPRNRFWKVLAFVLEEPVPETIEEKKNMLRKHHIALWDVLASCSIEGASDASIRDAVPNDMNVILSQADIRAVFATGSKAASLFRRYCEPLCGRSCIGLPSTSPANCRVSDEELQKSYEILREYLK